MNKNWTTSPSFIAKIDELSVGEKKMVGDVLVELQQFLSKLPYKLFIQEVVLQIKIRTNLTVLCQIEGKKFHIYDIQRNGTANS